MKLSDLKNRKVGILGLSTEGISTAKFLLKNNIKFSVLDKKINSELNAEAREVVIQVGTDSFLGESYLDKLGTLDIIFRTPGFPLWDKKLQGLVNKGALIYSQTKLFFDLCPCPIIGVTGTKGKGTTSTLIYEMLKSSGFDAYLGGNIGLPPLDFLDKLRDSSVAVLELSSFQLEDLEKSPHIAVVLMTTSEHLSSQAPDSPNYHRSIDEYINAKKNIVKFQGKEDKTVINYDFDNSKPFFAVGRGQVYFFSVKEKVKGGSYIDENWLVSCINGTCQKLVKREDVFLRGAHNLQNVLAASTASLLAGAKPTEVIKVLKTFKGLEHRLEFVREIGSVKYYNDSFSTTPETSIAAIYSFSEPEILILGGSDKGSNYTELGETVVNSQNIKAVILIGNMAERIESSINQAKLKSNYNLGSKLVLVRDLNNMNEIIKKCIEIGSKGDVVVLSPACASFDMFKNYKDRGQQFKDEVNKL